MRRISWLCVLLCGLTACGGGEDTPTTVRTLVDTLGDHMRVTNPVSFPGSAFGLPWDDVWVVMQYDWETREGDVLSGKERAFAHVAGSSGLADGDEICYLALSDTFSAITGLDARERMKMVEVYGTGSTCTGFPPGEGSEYAFNAQDFDAATSREGSLFVEWEPTTDVTEAVSDYFFVGGRAYPFAICDEADFAPGRNYCAPKCAFPCTDYATQFTTPWTW